MEKWKDVKEYEGFYEVSNLGRIRRKDGKVKSGIKNNDLRFIKGKMLKQHFKKEWIFNS